MTITNIKSELNSAFNLILETFEPQHINEKERETLASVIDVLNSAQNHIDAQAARIAELEDNQALNIKIKQAMFERFTRAEAELARRDAAAGEPVYQMRLLDGEENCSDWVWVTETEYRTPTTEKYGKWERRILYTAAQPSALPPEVTSDIAQERFNVRVGDSESWANGANWMREQFKAFGCKAIDLSDLQLHRFSTTVRPFYVEGYEAHEVVTTLKLQGFTVEGEDDE